MRLKLGGYLGLWALLTAIQLLVTVQLADHGVGLALLGLVAVQLAKLPVAAGRLRDLGRPPDGAILALCPLANLGLWLQLLRGTPSEERRARLQAQWQNQVTAIGALGRGLRVVGSHLPVVLVLASVAALAGAWVASSVQHLFEGLLETRSPEVLDLWAQGAALVGALSLIYTVLQIPKRHIASRLSWLPSLFAVPAFLVALAFTFRNVAEDGPISLGLMGMGLQLLWQSFVGAGLAVAWVVLADRVRRGESASMTAAFAEVWDVVRRRALDVAVPYGTRVIIVTLGFQALVLPGIHYALVLALTEHSALFDEDRNALRRSGALTKGIRRKIFQVLYLPFMVAFLGPLVLKLALYDSGLVLGAYMFGDIRGFGLGVLFLAELLGILAFAVSTAGLLWVYRDRVALLAVDQGKGKAEVAVDG